MRLTELSPAEQRYLSRPLPPVDHWTPLLMKSLARLLSARMKCSVNILPAAPEPNHPPSLATRQGPEVVWDGALEAMWIRARLGARARMSASCTALSRNLQHNLQQLLAETWLSMHHETLPATVCWRIVTSGSVAPTEARVTIHFADTLALMDRWAQRIIAS